jgi:hypothetical protein
MMLAIYEANVFSVRVPDPSVVPTPFSKKQPPPKDSPTAVTLVAAALNAPALAELGWPFQSLHACVASTVTVYSWVGCGLKPIGSR